MQHTLYCVRVRANIVPRHCRESSIMRDLVARHRLVIREKLTVSRRRVCVQTPEACPVFPVVAA